MEKKITLIFFVVLSVGVLFFVNLVSAQATCSQFGQVNYQTGQYCDGSVYVDMKNDGSSCLNNFECVNVSCIDRVCQSRFAGLPERRSLIEAIWDLVQGKQCTPPGYDECSTDNKLIRTCSINLTWEDVDEYVDERCGFTSGVTPPGDGSKGKGGGGGCLRNWTCTSWSNSVNECGTRECTDTGHCGGWPVGRPNLTKECPSGPVNACGNGKCDKQLGESSVTCLQDCPAPEPKNYEWLFWLIIILLIIAIIIVAFFIWRRYKKNKEASGVIATKKEIPKLALKVTPIVSKPQSSGKYLDLRPVSKSNVKPMPMPLRVKEERKFIPTLHKVADDEDIVYQTDQVVPEESEEAMWKRKEAMKRKLEREKVAMLAAKRRKRVKKVKKGKKKVAKTSRKKRKVVAEKSPTRRRTVKKTKKKMKSPSRKRNSGKKEVIQRKTVIHERIVKSGGKSKRTVKKKVSRKK